MLKICPAVVAILDIQLTRKKNIFSKRSSNEHSSQVHCQTVYWFQKIITLKHFPIGSNAKFVLWRWPFIYIYSEYWQNKMAICFSDVYNWHQFVIIITCCDNVFHYLVTVFSSLGAYFIFVCKAKLIKEWLIFHWENLISHWMNSTKENIHYTYSLGQSVHLGKN